MSLTREGFSREPVFPTSAVIDFFSQTVVENSLNTWKDDASGTQITLSSAMRGQSFNTSPVKITLDSGTDTFTLLPGTWEMTLSVSYENNGVTDPCKIRVAVVEDVAVPSTAQTYMVQDFSGYSMNDIAVGESISHTYMDVLANPVKKTFRLNIADGDTGGGIMTFLRGEMRLRRVGDYVGA